MNVYGIVGHIPYEHPVWLEAVFGTGRCEWLKGPRVLKQGPGIMSTDFN